LVIDVGRVSEWTQREPGFSLMQGKKQGSYNKYAARKGVLRARENLSGEFGARRGVEPTPKVFPGAG
jgi:hypothetical protein